jgi:hypothetical protein
MDRRHAYAWFLDGGGFFHRRRGLAKKSVDLYRRNVEALLGINCFGHRPILLFFPEPARGRHADRFVVLSPMLERELSEGRSPAIRAV